MMGDVGVLWSFIFQPERVAWIPYFLFFVCSNLPYGSILLLVITCSQCIILLNPVIIVQVNSRSIEFGSSTTTASVERDGTEDSRLLRCGLGFGLLVG